MRNILNYLHLATSLTLILFLGIYIFKGEGIVVENARLLALIFAIWIITLNIRVYKWNKDVINRKKKRIEKH